MLIYIHKACSCKRFQGRRGNLRRIDRLGGMVSVLSVCAALSHPPAAWLR